jgi:hypothetical protein
MLAGALGFAAGVFAAIDLAGVLQGDEDSPNNGDAMKTRANRLADAEAARAAYASWWAWAVGATAAMQRDGEAMLNELGPGDARSLGAAIDRGRLFDAINALADAWGTLIDAAPLPERPDPLTGAR